MIMIICMLLATITFGVYLVFFFAANENSYSLIAQCLIEQETEKVKEAQLSINLAVAEIKRTNSINDKKEVKRVRKLKKEMDTAQKRLDTLNSGKVELLDLLPMAGYRFIQIMKWDYTTPIVKTLNQKCVQFKEKAEAMHYTYYLLASLFSYAALGVGMFFMLMNFGLSMQLGTRAVIIAVIGFAVFFIMGYVPYDNVNSVIQKRAEGIENEFPQVSSKLALLTVAGMEVDQAWRLTCQNGKGVIYDEMNRVLLDLDNNVSPAIAYGKFIKRCNNKYTTKLATAIIQNMSKGNSEIARLFRELNDESWLEHKHSARRMGEKIQSKLMVPTMLMFLGIIILVIIPVVSGFNVM